jgi:hypothetical protein
LIGLPLGADRVSIALSAAAGATRRRRHASLPHPVPRPLKNAAYCVLDRSVHILGLICIFLVAWLDARSQDTGAPNVKMLL